MRRLILLLAVLIAVPLFAQTTHTISRIEVRGSVPARVVTTQTALVEGRSYTTADLEAAMGRLRRLPFVFDATYTVDGSTLVIDVAAVTRFFGELDAVGSGFDGNDSGSAQVTGGGRFFLGSGGVAQGQVHQFIAEGGEDGTAADLAYTHYGVAGTRLFLGASVSDSLRTQHGFDPDPSFNLFAGYPLTVRQSLRADFLDQGFRVRNTIFGAPQGRNSFSDRKAFRLQWLYDTTEDPYFSRRGLSVFAGPSFSDETSQFDVIIFDPADGPVEILSFRSEVESRSLDAGARHYWARGERGAIFGDVNVSLFQSENFTTTRGIGPPYPPVIPSSTDTDGASVSVGLGYAHNLFDFASHPALRHRVEAGANYARRYIDHEFDLIGDSTRNETNVNAAYVLRNNFATVRLTLGYYWD